MKDAGRQRKNELSHYLKSAILTMQLKPGDDLDEVSLSKEYNLSRTPLREVLRQLAGEGYVELRENRGCRVSEMSHLTLRDFFIAAPMIYAAVLQLAAKNANPDQIIRLKSAQENFKQALASGSGADRAIANNRFHEITGEMANNIYLLPSFHRLLIDHARIAMTFYRPGNSDPDNSRKKADDQHDAIINAIENNDESTAARLATEHWNLSRDQIEIFVMPAGLDVSLGSTELRQSA